MSGQRGYGTQSGGKDGKGLDASSEEPQRPDNESVPHREAPEENLSSPLATADPKTMRSLATEIRKARWGDKYTSALEHKAPCRPEIPWAFGFDKQPSTEIEENTPLFDLTADIDEKALALLREHKLLRGHPIPQWMASLKTAERTWLAYTLAPCVNALIKMKTGKWLHTTEVNALYSLLVKGIGSEVATEDSFGSLFHSDPKTWPRAFPKRLTQQLNGEAKYIALGINENNQHWMSLFYVIETGVLWIFDSLQQNKVLKRKIFTHFRSMVAVANPKAQKPQRAYDACFFKQNNGSSCGYIAVHSLAMFLHAPNAIERLQNDELLIFDDKSKGRFFDVITEITGLALPSAPRVPLTTPKPQANPPPLQDEFILFGDQEAEQRVSRLFAGGNAMDLDPRPFPAQSIKTVYNANDGIIQWADAASLFAACDALRASRKAVPALLNYERRGLVNAIVRIRTGAYPTPIDVCELLRFFLHDRGPHGTKQLLIEEYYGSLIGRINGCSIKSKYQDYSTCDESPAVFEIFGYRSSDSHSGILMAPIKGGDAYLVDSLRPSPKKAAEIFRRFQFGYHHKYPLRPEIRRLVILPCYQQQNDSRCGLIPAVYLYFLCCNPTRITCSEGSQEYNHRITTYGEEVIQKYVGVEVVTKDPDTPMPDASSHSKGKSVRSESRQKYTGPGTSMGTRYAAAQSQGPLVAPTAPKPHHEERRRAPESQTHSKGKIVATIVPKKFSRSPDENERALQYYNGQVSTPYARPGDRWIDLARRPQPIHPDGWKGWEWFYRNLNLSQND